MNLLCLVVDDELNSMGYLIRYIQQIPILNLVKVTDNAQDAKTYLENNKIDLLITDIDMPYFTGFELYDLFNEQSKVIFITGDVPSVTKALYKNAIAVLQKPFSFELFEQAVTKVYKIISFDKNEETRIAKNFDIDMLSQAEKEVFVMIGEGKTTIQIAELRFVATKTIENQRLYIREKLKITGKHGLAIFATEYVKSLK